jgi:lysophospholipase L1-like esterase
MARKLNISYEDIFAKALKEGINNGREAQVGPAAAPQAITFSAPPPTERMLIESITLSVDGGDCVAQLNMRTGPDNGATSTSKRVLMKSGTQITIPIRYITDAGYIGNLGITEVLTGTPRLRGTINGMSITADLNFGADKVIMWIGDSVARGTTIGGTIFDATGNYATAVSPFDHFAFQVRNHFQRRGQDVRLVNKSMGGYSSVTANGLVKFGWYDIDQVDCIFYQMGINDTSGTPTSDTVFNANLDNIIDLRDRMYPNAKIVFVGASPLNNNTQETALINFRTLMSNKADVNDNIYFVSLASAFDRTVLSNYTSNDGVHPNIASNTLMATAINNWITANNFTI